MALRRANSLVGREACTGCCTRDRARSRRSGRRRATGARISAVAGCERGGGADGCGPCQGARAGVDRLLAVRGLRTHSELEVRAVWQWAVSGRPRRRGTAPDRRRLRGDRGVGGRLPGSDTRADDPHLSDEAIDLMQRRASHWFGSSPSVRSVPGGPDLQSPFMLCGHCARGCLCSRPRNPSSTHCPPRRQARRQWNEAGGSCSAGRRLCQRPEQPPLWWRRPSGGRVHHPPATHPATASAVKSEAIDSHSS